MVLEYTSIVMEQYTKVFGLVIYRMGKDPKPGQMVVHFMVNSKEDRKMEKGLINGMMGVITQGNGVKMK